ncbi:MAG: GNAT family N-acetyltransferase [Natronospirillum sp.]|uniref:GNAT family N-acetyltransferase n=1 Tax=Natronospirillum sp. TaxID=2812955 RepID=UPI0025F80606|nr:GNAT family N-acetyltransferase [Natronospirillum sp.]MCH8552623.1 GNAT family N-acetyltransferase [Natronospirillum sp.]
MTSRPNLVIQPLSSEHDRPAFNCGNDALNRYIQKQAKQDVKRRVSKVFVATETEHSASILGYYTLSSLSIELSLLPTEVARKLPRHPIPAALLGRLAVSHTAQGQGVGRMLLANALKRTLAVSDDIAIYAMVVDAIDQNAQRFYEQFGFVPLESHDRRLFLPLKSSLAPVTQ